MNRLQDFRSLIEPIIAGMGLSLVDVTIHGRGARTILRVFVDQAGGVTIERCAQASRAIEEVLERTELFPERYILEVSSPGIDRPLQSEQDFSFHIGRKVKVSYEIEQHLQEITGIIEGVSDGVLTLSTKEGLKSLPLSDILKAKLVLEF